MKRFKVIYEDDTLITVDKPSGILVIPSPKKGAPTLTELVNAYLDSRGVEVNAYPCHRIDRETSGLVLFAKGKRFQKIMMEEFRKRNVFKVYIAFVQGRPERVSGTLRSYIYNRNKRRYQLAITKYRVTESKKGFSVLELRPVTGRTNQIRIQCTQIGHPIIGERVFAFAKDYKIKFRRVALHAQSLEVRHPITKDRFRVTSELPEDMANLLR